MAAHTMLEGAKWRQVSWHKGTKGRLTARFAVIRVRVVDGAPQRIGAAGVQHMPGEEAWLVGEHRSDGERKYYLSNLPAETSVKGAIKVRRICEQAHQHTPQRGTGAGSLGGMFLDGPSPQCRDVDDGLRLLAIAQARSNGTKQRPWVVITTQPAGRQAILDRISQSLATYCPHCGWTLNRHPNSILPK